MFSSFLSDKGHTEVVYKHYTRDVLEHNFTAYNTLFGFFACFYDRLSTVAMELLKRILTQN